MRDLAALLIGRCHPTFAPRASKTCVRCKEEKPESAYYKTHGYPLNACKACIIQRVTERRRATRAA